MKASILYCDGSGWNGHKAAYAITDHEGNVIRYRVFGTPYTNNEMEYTAVLNACKIAPQGATIRTDSMLVVQQVHGEWKAKEKFKKAIEEIRSCIQRKKLELEWIPRKENLAGIFLEREGRKEKKKIKVPAREFFRL